MITHVAIIFDGKTYSLPKPNRHHHVIRHILETNSHVDHISGDRQGFLDDKGTFLNRREALAHALECEQVKDPTAIRAGRLFSEDVW